MIKSTLCAALLFLSAASTAADTNPCPCVPLTHTWVATACETWNCAQAAMVLANGDPYVVAVPTGSPSWKWVVLRRVVSGSGTVAPDAPFAVEQFDGIAEATARFSSLDHDALPMVMSMMDGKTVVMSLRAAARQRAAGR